MKQSRFDLRASTEEKKQFEQAAFALGMNLSSFIRMCALEKSAEVLKQSSSLVLSDRDRDMFLDLLENPPNPNKSLKRAMKNCKKLIKND
jgi:uncharacterized protein (DUF1778 family)